MKSESRTLNALCYLPIGVRCLGLHFLQRFFKNLMSAWMKGTYMMRQRLLKNWVQPRTQPAEG